MPVFSCRSNRTSTRRPQFNRRPLQLERLEDRSLLASLGGSGEQILSAARANRLASASAAALVDDSFEQNDTRTTAKDLGTLSASATYSALVQADSNDWYRFTTKATGGTSNAVSLSFLHSQGDLDFELYNSAGQRLGISQGTTNSEKISLSGRAAGTYYVRVYGYRGVTNPNYSLTIAPATTTAPPPVVDDSYEENDSLAAAKDLGSLSAVRTISNLALADTHDWYKFQTSGTGATSASVKINFLQAQGNLELELYDSAGTRLGFSTGTTGTETISLAGRAAGTYYVHVYGNQGAKNSNYSLVIDPTIATITPPLSTGGFDIQFAFSGSLTASQQAIFEQAAAKWESIIVGDLPNATYNGVVVDDLLIGASSVTIDGAGGILGQAGPDRLRSSGSRLPYHGNMQFDAADMASMQSNGTLLGVILHEMGHVIGVGTLWDTKGFLAGEGTSSVRFTGPQATAEYNALFGTSAAGVPVESDGGPGTADAHWDETLFGSELMTGWIGPSRTMPLSRITVASLADIGYTVNIANADPFAPAGSIASVTSTTSGSSSAGLLSSAVVTTSNQASIDRLQVHQRRQATAVSSDFDRLNDDCLQLLLASPTELDLSQETFSL